MMNLFSKLAKPVEEEEDVSDIPIVDGVEELVLQPNALAEAYGDATLRELFSSGFLMMCSAAAALGGFLFGFDQGLIAVILGQQQFLDVFPEIDSNVTASAGFFKGLMTAMLELGAALGAIQSGYLADKISRKYVLFMGVGWFFFGSAMQTGASDYAVLVLGRTFGGIGIGTLACVAPIYISEIAPPHLRGTLLVFESLLICIGLVVAFFISFGCRNIQSDWAFRLPFFLQMVPAMVLCGLFALMPFSPRWLCSKGRTREALDSLALLRQLPKSDARLIAEWISIRGDIENERLATQLRHPGIKADGVKAEILGWKDCLSRKVWRRTIIGVGLQFFQQMIGVNAVIYYSPSLFEALGFEREKQLVYAGIANVMQVVGVFVAMGIIDRVGRKPLLFFGSAMCLAAHSTIAALIGVYSDDWPSAPKAANAGVAMIMLFMLIFGLSWSPIPWAMPPEVMPSSFRSKGVAMATVSNWMWNFVVGLITPVLIADTNWGTFVFFAAFAFLSLLFIHFLVVETKGVRLEEMDKQFHDNSNHEDTLRLRDILFSLVSGQGIRAASAQAFGKEKSKPEVQHKEFTGIEPAKFDSSGTSMKDQPPQ